MHSTLPTILSLLLTPIASAASAASTSSHQWPNPFWHASQFKNFVVFGDSYTDENRLNYFGSHNGQAPPPGTVLPESLDASSGGRIWARYVVQYTGQTLPSGAWDPSMTLYDYAVSGAVCSNKITPRTFSTINADFPDIQGYELPAYEADLKAGVDPSTGQKTFPTRPDAGNTVYAIYIGTNDLGADAFLTDSEVPGTSIPDYLDCAYSALEQLYALGGRYFVINNVVPLNLAPLYANASEGGIDAQQAQNYWPTGKGDNLTAIAEQMREYVDLVNQVYEYRTPFESLLSGKFFGAKFALYDVHKVFEDIHRDPEKYLNGTAPLNVTAGLNQCTYSSTGQQTCVRDPSPDSFMWYDSLHPSEQTDRIVAREFVNVLNGNSSYATYWGF